MNYLKSVLHFLHKHFFYAVIASYIIAGFFPRFGLLIRDVSFGSFRFMGGSQVKVTLPLLMLSLILFNAGLGIKTTELTKLCKKPLLLTAGLLFNLFIPVLFTFIVSKLMGLWHNPDEVQNILVGLALIASMPIAASSTAWSQKSNGNMALSLGLVVLSTILSPLTTPIGLHLIGFMAQGDYAADLHEIAQQGTGAFLTITVLLPTILGLLLHFTLGEKSIESFQGGAKSVNLITLLLLNYSNAASVLPKTFAHPDWDFLTIVLIITGGLCVTAFLSGGLIAKCLSADKAQQSALMFGLGMNNNGTGLVLASIALANHPTIMLPIIFYNLVQHIIAGYVDARLLRASYT